MSTKVPVLFDILAKQGISNAKLSKMTGISAGNISDWKSGRSAPKPDALEKIAKALNCSVDNLLGNTPEPSNIRAVITDGIYNIPVFESVSAGFGSYASEYVMDYIPVIIKNPSDVDNTIAIKVSGDSMYPKIEDGDIIVVRRQTSVDSGDIGVVLLDGEEGLVKQIVYGPTWIELQSINEKYPVQRFDGAEVMRLRVVGKVTQIVKIL